MSNVSSPDNDLYSALQRIIDAKGGYDDVLGEAVALYRAIVQTKPVDRALLLNCLEREAIAANLLKSESPVQREIIAQAEKGTLAGGELDEILDAIVSHNEDFETTRKKYGVTTEDFKVAGLRQSILAQSERSLVLFEAYPVFPSLEHWLRQYAPTMKSLASSVAALETIASARPGYNRAATQAIVMRAAASGLDVLMDADREPELLKDYIAANIPFLEDAALEAAEKLGKSEPVLALLSSWRAHLEGAKKHLGAIARKQDELYEAVKKAEAPEDCTKAVAQFTAFSGSYKTALEEDEATMDQALSELAVPAPLKTELLDLFRAMSQ